MILFVVCIAILYCLSFFNKGISDFKRDKAYPLKGIMAILIVLHHLSACVEQEWIQSFHSWGAPVVSMFFFMSGYGLTVSVLNRKSYMVSFLKYRVLNALLIPFIIVFIGYVLINTHDFNLLTSVLRLLSHGEPTLPHSWFVYSILILYLCFWIACKVTRGNARLIVLSLLCVGYIFMTMELGYARCWYISILAFPFGAVYATYERQFHTYLSRSIQYYSAVPISLCLMAGLFFLRSELAYMLVYILIPFILVCLCMKIKVEKLNQFKIVGWISGISYEIYLCQGIAMDFIRGKYVHVASDTLYIILSFILTFLLAYGVKYIKDQIVSLPILK